MTISGGGVGVALASALSGDSSEAGHCKIIIAAQKMAANRQSTITSFQNKLNLWLTAR
jgi:hypothetical protein